MMDISNPRKMDALGLWHQKTPLKEIAHKTGVSVSIIRKWIKDQNAERFWMTQKRTLPESQKWEPKSSEEK